VGTTVGEASLTGSEEAMAALGLAVVGVNAWGVDCSSKVGDVKFREAAFELCA
jgi:hypothetical protein